MRILRSLAFLAVAGPALVAAPAACADTLAEIRERGYFVFGLEAQYRPFEFRDESGEIVGYDIDIAAELGERLGGVEPRPVDTNWSTVIQSLYNGDFDMILGGMTATEERFQRVDFSYPYMDASSGLLVPADSGIESPADLAGRAVAAGAGTPQIGQLELSAETLGIAYDGDIRTYDDDTVAVAAMKAGRIEAYASTLVSLLELAKAVEGVTVIPFTSDAWPREYTAMAFRKEDTALREAIDAAIVDMKADGTLAALQEKWFGQSFVEMLPDMSPSW